jgi:Tfp pilus assembly protein PilF
MPRTPIALLVLPLLVGCASGPGKLLAPDPTRDHYQRILENQRARQTADSQQLAQPSDESASLDELVARGDRLRRSGERREALKSYLQAVSRAPDSLTPRARIGYLHLKEDPKRAAGIFSDLVGRDPASLDGWLGLALARLVLGDARGALDAIEHARRVDPRAPQLIPVEALARDQRGEHADAQRLWARALERRPGDAALLNNLGHSYLASGDFAGAEGAFRRALSVDPRSAVSHNNLGVAQGRQGDYAAALASFRRAGSEGAALTNLGWVHHENGDYEGAIAQYMRALDAPGVDKLAVLRNLEAAETARLGIPPAAGR